MTDYKTQQIVFFDGICVLCNGFVDFLLSRELPENLKFASLQGETARQVFPKPPELASILFYDRGTVYSHSTAVLKILQNLPGNWKVLAVFLVIPASLRDWIYNGVAKRRYRWFGTREVCRMSSQGDGQRILP